MSNDDVNKKIDSYYNKDLDEGDEVKVALDNMDAIKGIEEGIELRINVAEAIEKGESIKLKKYTIRFISVAIIFSLFLLTLASRLDLLQIIAVQFGLLVLLLVVNIFFRSNKLKGYKN